MGSNHAWFMLTICFVWTIVIIISAIIYLNEEEKPLTLSHAEENFDLVLFDLIKSNLNINESNSKSFRPIKVHLKDKVVLINDRNIKSRNEKLNRLLDIRDQRRLEDLKVHEESSVAVLVFVCDRVTVRRCLDRLLLFRPSSQQFPIIVSQDCSHTETENAIREFGDQIYFVRQPKLNLKIPSVSSYLKGYYYISSHYGQALNLTFFKLNFNYVIIVEDDLEISSDFFEYFLGTLPILKIDPTLWCVSAWNDHGKMNLINHNEPEKLYRTDFFPGLGWMLSKNIWLELSKKWPLSYWDDWMRLPEQRKDRACIRPEVPRTKSFGKFGVSSIMFYKSHLHDIYLNKNYTQFTSLNLSYLLKENYDTYFLENVYQSPVIYNLSEINNTSNSKGVIRLLYNSESSFKKIAKRFNLLDDFKSGVPRSAYKGVVSLYHRNQRIYLTPSYNWTLSH